MVFIVDDDFAVRDSLGMLLETAGFDCQTFESAECFLQAYSPDTHDCLLLDFNMPEMNGLELQAELIRRDIHLPIIFLSAHDDLSTKQLAINAGAIEFLTKPVPNKLLIKHIEAILRDTKSLAHK